MDMEIKLFGNNTILITSYNGKIIIDPYFSNKGNPMFKRSKPVCDDYNNIDKLDGILLTLPVTNYFPPMTMNKESVLKAIDALKPEYFIPTHKDLVKRIRHIDCTVTKDEMSESLSRIKTKTKLIYLENGEVFTEVIENK